MFAYDDMLVQVPEWHDKGSAPTSSKHKVPKPPTPRTIIEEWPKTEAPTRRPSHSSQHNTASPAATTVVQKQQKSPSSPSRGPSADTTTLADKNHLIPSLSPRLPAIPAVRRNVIPLRQAVTPRGKSDAASGIPIHSARKTDKYAAPPQRTVEYLSEVAFNRLCRPRTDFAAKEKERLMLLTPRRASGEGLSGSDAPVVPTERRSSVLKMQAEFKERQEAARKEPGTIPFNSGGTRNSAWFKHLPVPEHLEDQRMELRAEREKNGAKESEAKLVERLFRFPRRPEPKCAPPREPLDDEEEAALVKRLYVVRSYDDDYEDEEGDEAHEGEDGEEIDIDDQVDRLYYQAIVQQKKRREKLEDQQRRLIRAMRTPRTNSNTSGRQLLQSSSTQRNNKGGRSPTSSPTKRTADASGDEEEEDPLDESTPNKKPEQQLRATFERLYDKEHYDRRTEIAYKKAGYLI